MLGEDGPGHFESAVAHVLVMAALELKGATNGAAAQAGEPHGLVGLHL